MLFRSMVIREGQPSTWLPPEPRYQAAEHGLVRVVVGLGSQPDLAVLVELVAWKAARPRLVSCQLGRTRGAVWLSVKRRWRDGPCHQCHRGAPRSPWSSPSGPPWAPRWPNQDTPFTLPSVGVINPSWWWSWLRVGVTGKLVVKMNIPVAVRNATTLSAFTRTVFVISDV